MALSVRERIQAFGLAYWAIAAMEMMLIIVAWNTSLISSDLFSGVFMVNFVLGLCGFSAIFIFGTYMGTPQPTDRLLFNKEPFPRASGTLAAAFILVAVVLVVSMIKINQTSHGWSSANPTSSCADRVSRVVQTAHDKWIRYKCVSHQEWVQIDTSNSLSISTGSSLIVMVFGTVHLAMSIAQPQRRAAF